MHRNLCLLPGPPEMEIGVITQGDASCKCEDISCVLNEEIFCQFWKPTGRALSQRERPWHCKPSNQ